MLTHYKDQLVTIANMIVDLHNEETHSTKSLAQTANDKAGYSKIIRENELFKVANVEVHVILKDLKDANPGGFLRIFSHVLTASHKWCNFSDTMTIVLKCKTDKNQECIDMVKWALKKVDKPYISKFARLKLLEIIINDTNVLTKTFSAEEKRTSESMPIPKVPSKRRRNK